MGMMPQVSESPYTRIFFIAHLGGIPFYTNSLPGSQDGLRVLSRKARDFTFS
jgi:hypothetical protein